MWTMRIQRHVHVCHKVPTSIHVRGQFWPAAAVSAVPGQPPAVPSSHNCGMDGLEMAQSCGMNGMVLMKWSVQAYLDGPNDELDLGIWHPHEHAVAHVKPVVVHEGVPCDGVLQQRLRLR